MSVLLGKTNGGDKRNVSSLIENQDNRDSKALNQPNHPVQGMGGDCMAPSVATPADVHEAGVSPQFLHASGHYRTGTPFLTVLQPDTLACTGESKVSPNACFSTRDLESSCALPQKEGESSFQKREWLHQSKNMNCEGVERHIKHPGCKDHQLLDRTELEKVSAKENRQDPVLSAYRDSWGGKHTGSVKHSPCPIPVFTCDSENSDKDCWSQLFTEDSQGQQVIAHKSRPPFRDVSNNQNQGLGQFPNNARPHCQDVSTQLNLQPDLLFTQDSEGNQVIRHQVGMYL